MSIEGSTSKSRNDNTEMSIDECHIDCENEETEQSDRHVQVYHRRKNESWVNTDQEMLREQINQENNSNTGERKGSDITKIQTVAHVMLQNTDAFKKSYKPRAWTIGPIHHHARFKSISTYSHSRFGQLKIKLAAKFIAEGSGNTWQNLLKLITPKIKLVKKFFEQEIISVYDDDSLVWLLFLDGCAVLQFIHSYVLSADELKELQISNGDAALIHEDLFLLENQFPFQLLLWLMENMNDDKKGEYLDAINLFVLKNNIMAPIDCWSHDSNLKNIVTAVNRLKNSPKLPMHFLDARRSVLLGDRDRVGKKVRPKDYLDDEESSKLPKHMHKMLQNMQQDNKMSFRNVQELKSAGIKVKCSDSENMRSISFSRRWLGIGGYLSIPPINVDNSTARKLLNLVAYEVCLRDSTSKEACYLVTSYVHFMDLLIDNEKDVKELRKAGILRHRLSTDNDVASLFNSLGSKCLLLSSEEDVFIDVKSEIDNHCERKLPKWAAEFRRNHCSSPWALISLLFVLVTAYLTLLQEVSSTISPRGQLLNFNGIAYL